MNGARTNYKPARGTFQSWKEVMLSKADLARVARIQVHEHFKLSTVGCIKFYDRNFKLLLQAGDKEDPESTKTKEFELKEGERVIGMRGVNCSDGTGWVRDIQFVIGRLE